jgi:hypothetical protein
MVIYSLLLVVIMIARPQGLFGGGLWVKTIWKRFRPSKPQAVEQ